VKDVSETYFLTYIEELCKDAAVNIDRKIKQRIRHLDQTHELIYKNYLYYKFGIICHIYFLQVPVVSLKEGETILLHG
jgi:hypothetical protein